MGKQRKNIPSFKMPNLKPSTKTISLRLPQHLLDSIKAAANGLAIHTQAACQGCCIQQTSLGMCQHRPETAQGLGGNAWPQLGDVTFQISADKILPPSQAQLFISSQKTIREATPYP